MSASAVTILVRANVPNAFKQMELRGGAQDQPYAIKTPSNSHSLGGKLKRTLEAKLLQRQCNKGSVER